MTNPAELAPEGFDPPRRNEAGRIVLVDREHTVPSPSQASGSVPAVVRTRLCACTTFSASSGRSREDLV
jgi:hypothetical protein